MTKKEFETGAVCLRHPGLVASWGRTAANTDPRCRKRPQINIFEAAVADNDAYYPAASLTINGREALLALREAIDAALLNEPEEEESK